MLKIAETILAFGRYGVYLVMKFIIEVSKWSVVHNMSPVKYKLTLLTVEIFILI